MINIDKTRCMALVSKPFAPPSKRKQCPNLPAPGGEDAGFGRNMCAEHRAHWIEINERVTAANA